MTDVPYVVVVDREIADLVPQFLANRHADLERLEVAIRAGDFAALRRLGHSMKGSGGGYGFDGLSTIGAAIEQAALDRDVCGLTTQRAQLADYLARVEVRYAD